MELRDIKYVGLRHAIRPRVEFSFWWGMWGRSILSSAIGQKNNLLLFHGRGIASAARILQQTCCKNQSQAFARLSESIRKKTDQKKI